MITLKTMAQVQLPALPTELRTASGAVMPLEAVTEDGLRALGEAWTAALVTQQRARAERSTPTRDEPERREQLTIGEFIAALEKVRPGTDGQNLPDPTKPARVCYAFAGAVPTTLGSYRGYYAQLALGWADPDKVPATEMCPTTASLLAILRGAVGATFTGYKGGEYTMRSDTPIWVANHGDSPGTAIVGVRDLGYGFALIETEHHGS